MNTLQPSMPGRLPDGRPFLAGWSGSDNAWQRYARLFLEVEGAARSFAMPAVWAPIAQVRLGSENVWSPNGTIKIAVSDTNWGVLFHEVFHSAFHRSGLHAGDDERWGDAFCDAFRYFMEEKHLANPPSNWLLKMRCYRAMQPGQILEQSSDPSHDLLYALPASSILRRARCFDSFRMLWHEINGQRSQSRQDVCNTSFDFKIS